MFNKAQLGFLVLSALSMTVDARERIMERDGKAVVLHPRRFGQEQPAVIAKLGAACPGQVCGVLSGAAITPLLAAQPACSQQDHADRIIDEAQQFDAATKANMIALAIEYRKAEKNTPPDFTTNPPTPRNSVFCLKAPKNPELNGLVQAQDPANGDVFFDPETKASVQRGAQANTAPFTGAGAAQPPAQQPAQPPVTAPAEGEDEECPAEVTVTVTATPDATAAPTATEAAPTGGATNSVAPAPTAAPPAPAPGNGNANIGNFGICTVPEIVFAAGFDNRRETSFRPKDLVNFNHGSAQNIDIITRFMCDQLVNRCKADQTARATCATAAAAASAGTKFAGVQADLFNKAFGITTNFAGVQQIDNQGRPVGTPAAGGNNGNNGGNNGGNNNAPNTSAAAQPTAAPAPSSTSAAAPAPAPTAAPAPGAGNGNGNGNAPAAGNLQPFTAALGGVVAPVVTAVANGRFAVANNAEFNNLQSAIVRSCDVQNNQCANKSNGDRNAGFSVGDCNAQQAQCITLARTQ